MNDLPAETPTPAEQVETRDLLDRAYQLMDPQMRQIAQSRAQGAEWADITDTFGGTVAGRRKQFCRAMNRIAQTLQVD